MPIKKISETYKTSDGSEFLDQAMAKRHEAMLLVKTPYETARRNYAKALAATQITADGRPFDPNRYGDYFFVTEGRHMMPVIKRVSFSYWRDIYLDGNDEGSLIQYEIRQGELRPIRYEIGKLYALERNAENACLDAMKKRLSYLKEEVDQFQNKLEER